MWCDVMRWDEMRWDEDIPWGFSVCSYSEVQKTLLNNLLNFWSRFFKFLQISYNVHLILWVRTRTTMREWEWEWVNEREQQWESESENEWMREYQFSLLYNSDFEQITDDRIDVFSSESDFSVFGRFNLNTKSSPNTEKRNELLICSNSIKDSTVLSFDMFNEFCVTYIHSMKLIQSVRMNESVNECEWMRVRVRVRVRMRMNANENEWEWEWMRMRMNEWEWIRKFVCTLMKGALMSLAIRRATSVLPQPVGPIIRIFFGMISSRSSLGTRCRRQRFP
jgi:hypothetical protein